MYLNSLKKSPPLDTMPYALTITSRLHDFTTSRLHDFTTSRLHDFTAVSTIIFSPFSEYGGNYTHGKTLSA